MTLSRNCMQNSVKVASMLSLLFSGSTIACCMHWPIGISIQDEEAEDAVQYTFMKLWEQRERFDFQSGIRSLLFTILKNYILNELRHRNLVFEKHYEMAQKDEEADDGFLKDFEDKDFREHLRAAIGKLPPQKQRICRLKIEKGLSNQEIADEMHITVPTVKSHYTQAIKILRAEIESLIVLLHVLWIHFLG